MWAEPPLFAGRPRTHVEAVYVRVTTDKGVVGWGECNGFSGAAAVAAVEIVSRVAVGQDPTDPELTPRIQRLLHGLGRAGVIMHAISGLDIALWDIRGKLEGVSVSKLLGRAQAQARRDLRVADPVRRQRRERETHHRPRAGARLQAHQAA